MRQIILSLVSSTAVLTAACAELDQWPPPGPPNYRLGFGDGCWSGYEDAGRQGTSGVKRALYGTDADYKQGWHEGWEYCYDEERRNPWVGGPSSRR